MSDVVVVDASFAIKWVLSEPDSSIAIALLKKWTDEKVEITAPALLIYEVTNIIYRRVVTNLLTFEEAMTALSDLFSIGISFDFSEYKNISTQAMTVANRFHLSASYDSHYLALAQRENCEYWTADTRLFNTVQGKLNWVRWIGNNQS